MARPTPAQAAAQARAAMPAPIQPAYQPVSFFVDLVPGQGWVPVKRTSDGTRIELMAPSPYRSVAWERLSGAVMDEYLTSTGL